MIEYLLFFWGGFAGGLAAAYMLHRYNISRMARLIDAQHRANEEHWRETHSRLDFD